MTQIPNEKSPQPPHHESDAAHAILAAIAQIGLALRESQEPVAELGSLIAHIAETLGALRSARFGRDCAPDDVPTVNGLLEQLQSDVYKGIQQLQFYDRMVQHLSHLQEYLICVANQLGTGTAGGKADRAWDELNSKLRVSLISEAQRGLLDLFLTPEAGTRASQVSLLEHSMPGSLEIF